VYGLILVIGVPKNESQLASLNHGWYICLLTMIEPLSIPEEKRMPDASLRNRALGSVATAYSAGVFAGLASHYLDRPA
jgi:hypothetical protein